MINFVNVVLVDFLPKIASFGPKKLFFKFCTVFYHIFNYFWVENVKFKKKSYQAYIIALQSVQNKKIVFWAFLAKNWRFFYQKSFF